MTTATATPKKKDKVVLPADAVAVMPADAKKGDQEVVDLVMSCGCRLVTSATFDGKAWVPDGAILCEEHDVDTVKRAIKGEARAQLVREKVKTKADEKADE